MLDDEQRTEIENRLRHERELALDVLADFHQANQDLRDATGELSLYGQHPADLGTEAMEAEKQFLLASVEGRRLYEIDAALQRLYAEPERFGSCESCGRPIPFERLELMPAARTCVGCQEGREARPPE
jgi:DnaK suppressor protein